MHRTLSVDSKQEFRPQIGDFINGICHKQTFVMPNGRLQFSYAGSVPTPTPP